MTNNGEHLYITNLGKTDWNFLKKEFCKFGDIQKVFVDSRGDFAKIYFLNRDSCQKAAYEYKHNLFGWQVTVQKDQFVKKNKIYSKETGENNITMYEEYADTFAKQLSDDYVNVHGDNVELLIDDESGETYVNFKDILKSGFTIFTRNEFEQMRKFRNEERINIVFREFNVFMLAQAERYLMENLVTFIKDQDIVDTINRCRNKLGIEISPSRTFLPNPKHAICEQTSRAYPQNRSHNYTSGLDFNLQPSLSMRPPKTLPNNFGPNHSQWSRGGSNNNRYQWNNHNNQDDLTIPKLLNRDSNAAGTNEQKQNFDTRSQNSDSSSTGKKSYLLKSYEVIDDIEKTQLEIDKTYSVTISHIEKDNICWVQCINNVDDLLIEINEAAPQIAVIENVQRGQLALAEFEDAWCRCRVIYTNPLNVLFIDYGNRENVDSVKELPQNFRKTPTAAIRIVIHKNSIDLQQEMVLQIKVRKQYEDDTYLVMIDKQSCDQEQETKMVLPPYSETVNIVETNEVKCKTPETPKTSEKPKSLEFVLQEQKHFFDLPKPLVELKNGDKVMLSGLIGNQFAVKTKECAQKSKEILEYIKNLNKSDLLLSSVKEGQLVLCSKDSLPSLCRGVVVKKTSPTIAIVKYLDFCGEDQLSIKSLRNVDEHLAAECRTLILTPEFEIISKLSKQSRDFIENIIEKREKVKVVISEDDDLDLLLEGGKFLSEALMRLEKTNEENVQVSATSTPKSFKPEEPKVEFTKTDAKQVTPKKASVEEPISYNDMPYMNIEVGSKGTYVCYTISNLTDMTLISMSDESLSYLEKVSDLLQDTKDETPCEPEVLDMCLVSHKTPEEEAPSWYRAVCIDKEVRGYVLSLIDFGNQIVVSSKDIRKFPNILKKIPVLGILCAIKNIENSEKNIKRVKELIPEGENVDIIIKEFVEEELKYTIEIPELYEKLKKEGLC